MCRSKKRIKMFLIIRNIGHRLLASMMRDATKVASLVTVDPQINSVKLFLYLMGR